MSLRIVDSIGGPDYHILVGYSLNQIPNMPIYYCATTGCGNRITYLTEKPKVCPKCGTAIADPLSAIASMTLAKNKTVKAKVEEELDDEDDPIIAPVRSSRSKPIVRKPAPRKHVVEASAVNPDDVEDEDEDEEEGDDEPYNPREARRLARELAASIDPSTITVGIEVDGNDRVTFRDWCATKASE